MAEDPGPAKKVVKRVVKKTVARPPATGSPEPRVRYGRPVTGTVSRPKAKAAAPPVRSDSPTTKVIKVAKRPKRPQVRIGGKVKGAGRAVTSRGSSAASGVFGAARSGTRSLGSRVSRGGRAVRSWRIPHWDPLPASIFTGAVCGLLAIGLGLGALAMFTHLRGVASGGGRWGSLTFVVVAFIAFVVGELLLSAFGSTQARLTSFLGVVLTIVAILGLFLGVADSVWALALVPLLGAAAYAISYVLLNLAEGSSTQPE